MVTTRSHDRDLRNEHSNSQKRKPGCHTGTEPGAKRRRATEEAVAVVIEAPRPRDIAKPDETQQGPSQLHGRADSPAQGSSTSPDKQESQLESETATTSPLRSSKADASTEEERSPAGMAPSTKRYGSSPVESTAPDTTAHDVNVPAGGFDGADERKIDEDDTSDNDLPEEATAAAGHDRVEAAFQQAAETRAKDEAARKAKRREHQQRMESQAKRPTQTKGDNGGKKSRSKAPLPALLPDEILNAEPSAPLAPVPRLPITAPPKANKKLLLDKIEKPPKDLVHGKTRIRVSSDHPAILPPKSSGKGKELREKWLMGQRGSKPAMWVSRQTPSKGFIRNSM